ncbi:hypothetical protein JYU34_012184 [Plutella xylostella]|uniref:Uncharacterized protein n=1 Tax=Plutella xylostella TaxID=51655 RepID=A0ABQ7QFC7_PLUXY|nr:hypothetical protein JYU34_012184 [Plutella xylostella]
MRIRELPAGIALVEPARKRRNAFRLIGPIDSNFHRNTLKVKDKAKLTGKSYDK